MTRAELLRAFECAVRMHEAALDCEVGNPDLRALEDAVVRTREAALAGDLCDQGASYWKARALAEGDRVGRLEGALRSLRPFFGTLKREKGMLGGSYFDAAIEAFKALDAE